MKPGKLPLDAQRGARRRQRMGYERTDCLLTGDTLPVRAGDSLHKSSLLARASRLVKTSYPTSQPGQVVFTKKGRRRGALRYFKDLIYQAGIQEEWSEFRDRQYREVAEEWCEWKDIPVKEEAAQTDL